MAQTTTLKGKVVAPGYGKGKAFLRQPRRAEKPHRESVKQGV